LRRCGVGRLSERRRSDGDGCGKRRESDFQAHVLGSPHTLICAEDMMPNRASTGFQCNRFPKIYPSNLTNYGALRDAPEGQPHVVNRKVSMIDKVNASFAALAFPREPAPLCESR
jgi:hypothetical protein